MVRSVFTYRVFIASVFLLAVLYPQESRAERGRVFGRNFGGLNAGRGLGGFNVNVGQFTGIPNFSRLIDRDNNANNNVVIGNNGDLNVLEQLPNGLVQGLRVLNDGRVIGLGTGREVDNRTQQEVAQLLAPLGNRDFRVSRINARATGNPGAFTGQFVIDITSMMPTFTKKFEGVCNGREMDCALAALNEALNQFSNNRQPLRISKNSLRRLPDGRIVANVNLRRFFNQGQINLIAQSDPTFRCTGRVRGNALLNFGLNPVNMQDMKGIRGLTRDQVFDLVGCNKRRTDSIRNKMLIMRPDGSSDSGVTVGFGRVAKFERQRRNNGAMCWESDDFTQDQGGINRQACDVRQTGIFYCQQNASEALIEQPNGLFMGLLFNNAGVQQNETPTSVTSPKVLAHVSCIKCHSKGILGGGRKIGVTGAQDKTYHNNLGQITDSPTVFRDSFGRQLSNRDFFIDNAGYRRVGNASSARQFRMKQLMGLFGERNELLGRDGYPLPFAATTFEDFDGSENPAAPGGKALSFEQMSAETGFSEQQLRSLGITGPQGRSAWDTGFCGLMNRGGGGRGFLAEQQGGRNPGLRTEAGVGGVVHSAR